MGAGGYGAIGARWLWVAEAMEDCGVAETME